MLNSHPIIELRGLRRRDHQSGREILDDVELTIDDGQCVGVVGPSGSGKSSLLRAIALLDPWNDGELRFLGEPIHGDQVPPFRRRVVYVAQQPVIAPPTLRDDLRHVFRFASARGTLDEREVDSMLVRLGKQANLLDQPVEQLSGGEKQIAALVRALCLSPQVLLLDEPTASLDAVATEAAETMIRQWRQASEQRAVVWVSHDPRQIERVATQVIELHQGRLIKPKQLTTDN